MNHSTAQGPDFGLGKKTLGIYITGFILCVLLTLIPFYVVMHDAYTPFTKHCTIFITAMIQFFVQVICFLRVNGRTVQAQINLYSFIFSIVVLSIIIGGSLWIMWNLNYNMMH